MGFRKDIYFAYVDQFGNLSGGLGAVTVGTEWIGLGRYKVQFDRSLGDDGPHPTGPWVLAGSAADARPVMAAASISGPFGDYVEVGLADVTGPVDQDFWLVVGPGTPDGG